VGSSRPDWARFAACRCGAPGGQPCQHRGRDLVHPHARRPKVKVAYTAPRDRGHYTDIHNLVGMIGRMVKAAGVKMRHSDAEDLRALVDIHRDLENAIRHGIEGLREDGYSWKSIGEALGVTGQAAYMRYGKAKAG